MKHGLLALAAIFLIGSSSYALAVDEPQNIIKYRQAVMKAVGGHMGAIVGVAKGEVSFSGDVAEHARSINGLTKMLGPLFPKGSGQDAFPETRALPNIWNDWAKFEAAVKDMDVQSAKLAAVAEGGDVAAITAQLKDLGKACGSCHKPFRAKKN